MADVSNPQAKNNLQDRIVLGLVKFFKAEWSGAFLAILILGIAIELASSGRPFFHPSNLMTILNNSAAIGIVAGGMTLVIITAGIDLSVGSVMGMTAALTGYVASFWGFPPYLAIMTGLGIGLAIGAFNGSLVAYFGMPAFIVTGVIIMPLRSPRRWISTRRRGCCVWGWATTTRSTKSPRHWRSLRVCWRLE